MRAIKKAVSLILVFMLIFSLLPTAFAADNSYTDVPRDHWASSVISMWSGSDYGVLEGNGDGTFAPDRGVTLAELAAILSKTFGYTERVSAEVTPEWANEHIEKAVAAGVIEKAERIDASAAITREQAIRYIAIAYSVSPVEGDTPFVDDSAIGADYKPYVNAFQRLGYVVGRGNNDFDPQGVYTRAEAMQVIDNMTSDVVDKTVDGQNYSKNLIIRKSGVTVSNTGVSGDLFVGHGVGDGKVTLNGVTIGGTLIIYGGGSDSKRMDITLNNTVVDSVVIVGSNVNLLVNNGSTVENVTISANNVVINGGGTVKNVYVTESAKSGVNVLTSQTKVVVDGNAGKVYVQGGVIMPGTSITTNSLSSDGGNSIPVSSGGVEGSITDIIASEGNQTITAEVSASGACYLNIRVLSDASGTGKDWTNASELASGRLAISGAVETELIDVSVSSAPPKYFIVVATLVDARGIEICDPFVSISNTSVYEDFGNLTVNDFSADTIINLDQEADTNFMVISSDVSKIIAGDGGYNIISVVNENTFKFTNADSNILSLNAGDKIVVEDGQDIYIIEITGIAINGSEVTITANSDCVIAEFFDHIKINVTQEVDNAVGGSPARAASNIMPFSPVVSQEIGFSPSAQLSKQYPYSKNFNKVFSGGSAGNLELDAWIGLNIYITTEIEYSVTWSFIVPTGLSLYARIGVGYDAEIDATATYKNVPADGKPLSIKVFNGTAALPYGVTASLDIDLIIDWSVSAEGGVNMKSSAECGIIFNNGSVQTYTNRSGPTLEPRFEGSATFSIGPKVTAKIGWLGMVAAEVWIHPKIEAKAYAYYNVAQTAGDSRHECNGCLGGTCSFVIDAGFKVSYNVLVFKGNIVNRTYSGIVNVKLFEFYFSFDNEAGSVHHGNPVFAFGACPNYTYKTTLTPQDQQGRTIANAAVSVTGAVTKTGTGSFVAYLYPGNYTASASVDKYAFTDKPFTVVKQAQTVAIQGALIAVTGVTLNKSIAVISVGGTETLVATVSPSDAANKEVIWSSSNTNIASVDSTGKVTMRGSGEAIITVTTMDGSKTASCTVTTVAPIFNVTVQTDGNGTAAALPSSAESNASVTLSATPSFGYRFKEWQVVEGGPLDIAATNPAAFTMPENAVTVKAVFEALPAPISGDFSLTSNTKTYSGVNQSVTMSYSGAGANTSTAGNITVYYSGTGGTTYAQSTTAPKNAGTYNVAVTTAGGTDYRAITTPLTIGTLTINKAVLTVTADSKNIAFDEAPPTYTYTITGYVNDENASVITGEPTLSCVYTKGNATGSYNITVAQNTLAADNYSFTLVPGTLSVGLADQATLSINAPGAKTYGDGTFTLSTTGGSGGGAVSYSVTGGADVIDISGNTVTIKKAGTATVKATKAGGGGYNSAESAPITITVNKRSLSNATVTVSGTYVFNGLPQTPTPIVTDGGLISGDDYTVTGYSGTGYAGTVTVTITATGTGNYTGTQTGQFTISKAPGAAVGVPAVQAVAHNSITITALPWPDTTTQIVEYAISTASNGTGLSAWQESTTFSMLTAETTYYVYARSKENSNYNAGAYSVSAGISTLTDPGDGTAGNPFKVYDAETLKKVGTDVDGWSLSSHYIQTANINMTGQSFTPIGNNYNLFCGVYDGSEYTISNLVIYNPSENNPQSLFGGIGRNWDTNMSGVVRNVGLVGGSVAGNYHVGGIVGLNSGGTVENCYNTGTVTGTGAQNVGGIVGLNNGGTVKNCYNTGTVTGTDVGTGAVGGIVGINNGGTVENCYNTGSVTFSAGYVGGIAGTNYGTVENCYNTGNVTGLSAIGGIAGSSSNGTVELCVALNERVTATYTINYIRIGRIDGDGGFSGNSTLRSNYARSDMTVTYNSQEYFPENVIGGPDGEAVDASQYNNIPFWQSSLGWDFVNVWEWNSATNLPILRNVGGSQSPIAPAMAVMSAAPKIDLGDGTADNPFQVRDAETLRKVGSGDDGWSMTAHYIMTADIDMTGEAFVPIGNAGDGKERFTGSFDGQNHVISNLVIYNPDAHSQGLFGAVGSGGIVQNIGLVGGSVTGEHYTGGVVGLNAEGGTVRNSYNNGIVTSTVSDAGGVVGYNGGTVENCCSGGEVTGERSVGGIVGYNVGVVRSCYSIADIHGKTAVGGIVGHSAMSGVVENVVALNEGVANGVLSVVGLSSLGTTLTGCYAINELAESELGAAEWWHSIGFADPWWQGRLPLVPVITPVEYVISVESGGGGTVDILPYGGIECAFELGENVTVLAMQNDGYVFVEWQDAEGNKVSNDAEYSFIAENNMALIAVFAPEQASPENDVTNSIDEQPYILPNRNPMRDNEEEDEGRSVGSGGDGDVGSDGEMDLEDNAGL